MAYAFTLVTMMYYATSDGISPSDGFALLDGSSFLLLDFTEFLLLGV